jgi:hypothetical protein
MSAASLKMGVGASADDRPVSVPELAECGVCGNSFGRCASGRGNCSQTTGEASVLGGWDLPVRYREADDAFNGFVNAVMVERTMKETGPRIWGGSQTAARLPKMPPGITGRA